MQQMVPATANGVPGAAPAAAAPWRASTRTCRKQQRLLHAQQQQPRPRVAPDGGLQHPILHTLTSSSPQSTSSLQCCSSSSSSVSPACNGSSSADELLNMQSSDEEDIHRLLLENKQRISIPDIDEAFFAEPGYAEEVPVRTSPDEGCPGCPVYVMLPLDTVWVVERDGRSMSVLKKERSLEIALHTLKQAGVEGVMVDVWWGIVERAGPGTYDFSAYKRLFYKVAAAGLKVQAVMSFHAAGGNVGDTCKIPLPRWVLEIGEQNKEIYYTDKSGYRNRECLSLGCDEVPIFWGRTPVQVYTDFIDTFCDKFQHLFGSVLTEITIGLGPAGELRYPSYPEGDGRWRFPGVGEFQCYDRYMLDDLKHAAQEAGHPEWGLSGPHDAGHYNSSSWETSFFTSQGGSWSTPYGHFFLSWYSGNLIRHTERILTAAHAVLNKRGRPRSLRVIKEATDGHMVYEFQPACHLGIKLAGVHWWFKSRAHAAELSAGYYNTRDRDGYKPIMELLQRLQSRLSFTCVEMRDCEHPPEGRCSPQALLQQVIDRAEEHGVPLAGENALQRYDDYAFDRITESAFGRNARAGRLEKVTFLRMGDLMFDNWDAFSRFLNRMRCTHT
ncbi:beta-amylase [Dunaliella salina]|uniref:Beta-amylase n=1 Tax=Dunaliella salina TaxID=3046 RepID=A0ABQ7FXG7_DUNSA|nr:beta-amylase [Dunaliella salina]|eukprot:KAF5827053.1 beta-amylase [Dunaliella salina]